MIDYYKELGVDKHASLKEIKTAYYAQLKKYHPDLYDGDKTFAQDKTSLLNECYNTLKSEELRQEYDKQLFGEDYNKDAEPVKYKDDFFKEFFKNLKINLKLRRKKPKDKQTTIKVDGNPIVKKEDKTTDQLEKERIDKNKLTGLIIITVFIIIVIIALIFVL